MAGSQEKADTGPSDEVVPVTAQCKTIPKQRRAIFIEIQPTKDTSHPARPLHHARLVVTEVGQHVNGEPLDAKSRGRVYDRNDGKVIGTLQMDKTLEAKDSEEYQGLPDGWRSFYRGFTTFSDDEIETISNNIILAQQTNKTDYSVVSNNCLDFTTYLANHILDIDAPVQPMSKSEERKSSQDRNPMIVSPDPGDEGRCARTTRIMKPIQGIISMLRPLESQSKTFKTIAQAEQFAATPDDHAPEASQRIEALNMRTMASYSLGYPGVLVPRRYASARSELLATVTTESGELVLQKRATSPQTLDLAGEGSTSVKQRNLLNGVEAMRRAASTDLTVVPITRAIIAKLPGRSERQMQKIEDATRYKQASDRVGLPLTEAVDARLAKPGSSLPSNMYPSSVSLAELGPSVRQALGKPDGESVLHTTQSNESLHRSSSSGFVDQVFSMPVQDDEAHNDRFIILHDTQKDDWFDAPSPPARENKPYDPRENPFEDGLNPFRAEDF